MARHRPRRLPAPARRRISSRWSSKTAESRWHTRHQPWRRRGCRQTRHPPDGTWPWHQACDARLLSVRVVAGSSSCVVVLVYRTGPITSAFFAEFADVLERVATNVDPLYIVGDLNIRLDRTDDAWSRQLTDLWASYGLACRVSAPTHDRGGLLDVVVSRDDLSAPRVDIILWACPTTSYFAGQRRWSDRHLSILCLLYTSPSPRD